MAAPTKKGRALARPFGSPAARPRRALPRLDPARAGAAGDGERGNSRASHHDLHVTSLPTKHFSLLEPHVRRFHPPVVGLIYGAAGLADVPPLGEPGPRSRVDSGPLRSALLGPG